MRAAGDDVAQLLLGGLCAAVAVLAVPFVLRQATYLPHLQALSAGARALRGPKRQRPDFEPNPHEICIVVKKNLQRFALCRRPTHRAPLCGEPLRPTLVHLARLDGGGLVQMCALAGRRHAEVVAALLNANEVAPLGAISTRHIALRGERKQGIGAFVSLLFLDVANVRTVCTTKVTGTQ